MLIENKIEELGYILPEPGKLAGFFLPAVEAAGLVFTAGQVPEVNGEALFKGKIGRDLSVEQGYEAARICALNALSSLKAAVGDLDRIEKFVRLSGYVSCDPDFTAHSKVLNGASELFMQIFGDAAKHSRFTVGVPSLANNLPLEIEVIVKLKKE